MPAPAIGRCGHVAAFGMTPRDYRLAMVVGLFFSPHPEKPIIGCAVEKEKQLQIAELARRLDVPYRHVRYVLEQGILPKGVSENPGRGEHRVLSSQQAFWLAMVLVLKENGINAPLAGEIARHAQRAIPGAAANASWDPFFNPWQGRFDTQHEWYFDIGDLRYMRLATTAYPSSEGLHEAMWSTIARSPRPAREAKPLVVIRVDIAQLGRRLQTNDA